MEKQQIKRIVFYRIGAIGDIIHSLPLIKLTAELNPYSTIELIVGSAQVKELLEVSCNFITNIYLIKHKGIFDKPLKLFPKLDENEKFLKKSFAERSPDEFIYLHSNKLKANVLNKRIVKAKKLFVYKRDPELSAVSNYVVVRYPELREELIENPYAVLKYKTLVIRNEIASAAPRNDKVQAPSDQVTKRPSDPSYICIVLVVGSLRPHRAFPLLKWAQFIDTVLSKTDLKIKILGGPDEIELSREFEIMMSRRSEILKIQGYENRVENLIGKTSLYELAQLIQASTKLYSADTGILHIAAALGVPIESVFSITSEKRFGPFHPEAEVRRSASCLCKQSFTNIPKHCTNTNSGYAGCVWSVTMNTI